MFTVGVLIVTIVRFYIMLAMVPGLITGRECYGAGIPLDSLSLVSSTVSSLLMCSCVRILFRGSMYCAVTRLITARSPLGMLGYMEETQLPGQ